MVIPNHGCEIPNLGDVVFYRRSEGIKGMWRPIARGKGSPTPLRPGSRQSPRPSLGPKTETGRRPWPAD